VSPTLQLEESVQLHAEPKLLIEWSPRWDEFVTSIRPALSRSTARLAGEAPCGIRPYRGMLATWLIEAFLLFVAIVLPTKLAQLRVYVAPKLASHDVIYYSGNELPRTEDLGGSQAGGSGRAGGNQAHNRTQTIKIARGGSLVEKVVDAPNLKLPSSRDAVANLLAMRPDPGPPPIEGLRSSRRVPNLTSTVVAPAPNVIRDYTRGGVSIESVIAPAPSIRRDGQVAAPALNTAGIPPAPSVSQDRTLFAPALSSAVIAPAPNISRDKTRSAPALSAGVVPPAPGLVSRDISRSPVQMSDPSVVPPPVSAPVRETTSNSKLTLPAPSVIAPPPSADVSHDLHRLASGSIPDPARTVVPPPPTQAGTGSLVNSLLGKIFGTTDVVPPPPSVTSGTAKSGNGTSLNANVVPPPPSFIGGSASGSPHGTRNGAGTALNTNVVPPPPSVGGSGASGTRSGTDSRGGSLSSTNIVPPPPSVSSTGRGGGRDSNREGAPGGTLIADNVVPPPPSLGGGASASGSGRGARGSGLGGSLDAGSVLAPPAGGGAGGGSAVVISAQPGSKVGRPGSGGAGSLAMSPAGGDKPGLGGSGGGSGIGRGTDTGSGMTGEGPGAAKSGNGRGSDPNASEGISPTAGPGGAGSAPGGTPPVPGVSVNGGSSIVTLPSFGSEGGSNPSVPGRSSIKGRQGPDITIVATSRSGGAFNFYGKLAGDNYTVYVDTVAGVVVMQFADPASGGHSPAGTLTGPQALRSDLPVNLPRARMVVACVLDASGNLKNLHVLEPGPAAMTAKIMTTLPSWKFRPAMRGNQPVEVNAILGFGIDTNDRN
jgi:hypothetical protein